MKVIFLIQGSLLLLALLCVGLHVQNSWRIFKIKKVLRKNLTILNKSWPLHDIVGVLFWDLHLNEGVIFNLLEKMAKDPSEEFYIFKRKGRQMCSIERKLA